MVVYSGPSKLETRLDQIGVRAYAVGFQGLVRFIMTQLPQNEVIEDALRKEVKLVPEVVIRELVANALIHQDFSMGGASVMIEIYRVLSRDLQSRRAHSSGGTFHRRLSVA